MNAKSVVILSFIFFFFAAISIHFIIMYNRLIELKENIKKAWANIDVLLKQRHDELPKLVSVCEGYAQFEKSVLDRVMSARENYFRSTSIAQKVEASNNISDALKSLFSLVETYPDLKANQNFIQLQNRITQLEESLTDRREFFNDSVNSYNIRIQQFPDEIAAGFLKYRKEAMLKTSEEDKKDVDIKFKLS